MKASPWEKEDAIHEGIPILDCLVPKAFLHNNGKLTGMSFEKVRAGARRQGPAPARARPASPSRSSNATTCWSRSARRTPSPGSSATSASTSTNGACRCSTRSRCSRRCRDVFFGGDAAFGPKNIIWAVAQGHAAAISIDKLLHGEDVARAPRARRDAGVAEDGHPRVELRQRRHRPTTAPQGAAGATSTSRCATSRSRSSSASTSPPPGRKRSAASTATCRRCSRRAVHRVRRLRRHLPDRLHHLHRQRRRGRSAHAADARRRCNLDQDAVRLRALKTGRVMVKDEDVCLHCGLCAERCPTGAWDMQKFLLDRPAPAWLPQAATQRRRPR